MTQQKVTPYSDNPLLAEALAYIYIAQYVRPDGPTRAGVLAEDCQKRYYGQIEELISKGDIQEANWMQLHGYATTVQGTEKAQSILKNKVKKNLHRLNSKLALIPQRLLQYLIEEVFLSNISDMLGPKYEGRRVKVTNDVGRWDNTPSVSNEHPTFICLLANKDILSHRNQLCKLVQSMGLMITAHYYVSTGRGQVDEEIFVLSPELQSYLNEYTLSTMSAGYWCPLDLEEMHTVFHVLHPETIKRTHDSTDLNLSIPVSYRESVNEFINECLVKNQIPEFNEAGRSHFSIKNIRWYDAERVKRYQKPLIDFLLDQKPLGRKRKEKSKIEPPPIIEKPDAIKSSDVVTGGGDGSEQSKPGADLVLGERVSLIELRTLAERTDLNEDQRRESLSSEGPFIYPLTAAATHTAIFGMNGTGKSFTMRRIVRELVGHQVPVLIIDWHDEYDQLVRSLNGVVAVPPTATISPVPGEMPFTWNVLDSRFYSAKTTTAVIEDYIRIVVDLLAPQGLLDLSDPMKSGLSSALKLLYKENLRPNLKDIQHVIDKVQMSPATAHALAHRIDSFTTGSLGSIFCSETSFDPETMFKQTMCIRVRHLTRDHRSAVGLLVFFILRQVAGYFTRLGEVKGSEKVRHITILEEAPMVIDSNTKVEGEIIGMLQELRKFGAGLALVCRNPGIGKGILRETNQKISHRLDVREDVNTVADELSLSPSDKPLLRKLPRGVAFARIGGNPTEVVRIISG